MELASAADWFIRNSHCTLTTKDATASVVHIKKANSKRDIVRGAYKMQYIAHRREVDKMEQSMIDHLYGTAKLAYANAESFGCGDLANLCGLIHDVGKYCEKFQRRIRGSSEQVDHATSGAQLLVTKYGINGEEGYLAKLLSYCIAGHHGGMPDGGHNTGEDSKLTGRLQKKVEDYSAYEKELELPQMPSVSAGIRITDGFGVAFLTRMIFSSLVDADYLDTEAFMNGEVHKRGSDASIVDLYKTLMEEVSPFLNKTLTNELNALRTKLLENCLKAAQKSRGVFSLTAPTGSGKTIASISFALKHAKQHNLDRVIFVVPYNTIIEQNAKVFEEMLGAKNVLQHHCGVNYDSDDERDRKRYSSENWDYPIIVTSSVQFFESLFSNRPSRCRKLHNMANSVIIFDEAQMFPVPYLLPCVRALEELALNYSSSIVLCTATQMPLGKYFAYKKVDELNQKSYEMHQALQRVTYQIIEKPISDEELIKRIKNHESVLCIVNKRKTAQSLFHGMNVEKNDKRTFCLTTTMYPNHRRQVIKEIKERLKKGLPCHLISTSIVEAGVDFDFPIVYREKTGLDSLIQSAGRCNREGKRDAKQSVVYIFERQDAKTPKGIASNVSAYNHILRNYEDFISLEAIAEYFNQLFYIKGKEALDRQEIIWSFNRSQDSAIFPFKSVAQVFRLIENDTKTILIPKGEEAANLASRLKRGERTRELMRQITPFTVSLYAREISVLEQLGVVSALDEELFMLSNPEEHYNDKIGISLSQTGGQAIFM